MPRLSEAAIGETTARMNGTKLKQIEKPNKHDATVAALYRLSAKAGTGLVRYKAFRRWVGWLAQRQWMQRTAWHREAYLVERFFAETKLAKTDHQPVIRASFLNNRGDTFWERILDECTADAFESIVTTSGFSAIERVHHERQATMFVHYHGVFTPLFWMLLRHRGLDSGTVIGQVKQRLLDQNITPNALNSDMEHTRHLHMARRTLAKGGTVHILPDGYRGHGGIEVPFCGRIRTFRTGFAELALMTGASIIPVFVSSTMQERFIIDVLEPLDVGMAVLSHPQRVERLVRQYAMLLQDQWTNAPTNIKWSPMYEHLHLPIASRQPLQVDVSV